MSVAYELKQKRAGLEERLQEIIKEQADIQRLMSAMDLVIASYEPDYQPTSSTESQRRRGRPPKEKNSVSKEVAELFKGVNKRQAVLEVLREANQPISTAECAERLCRKLHIEADPDKLAFICNRLSAVLNHLWNAKRIRQAGTLDGRRVLWEIAA